jgi:hypothetical protein
MLAGGATAGFWAWRLRASLAGLSRLPPDGSALPARRAHRRAGRVAVVGSLLALAGAALVLAGMYARAPR